MSALERVLTELFAALARRYPPAFRARAETEMIRLFRHGLRSRRGALSRLWWAVRELADAVFGLPAAWLESREGRASLADGLGHDVRTATNALVRRPRFAAFVAITLALGIGANAAVFGVLHSVLLSPLPYDEPGQLVRMYWSEPGDEGPSYLPSTAFVDFREHLTTVRLTALDYYGDSEDGADLLVDGRPERVRVLQVSADYFDVLGANLVRGRPFSREDERRDAAVAVVSERLWTRVSGGDGAVGAGLTLDGVSHEVRGVVSSDFSDPIVGSVDVWLPEAFRTEPWQWENEYLTVLGRLRPGVSLTAARAEVDERTRIQLELPENPIAEVSAVLVPLRDDLVAAAEPMLLVLMGAVVVLLLIACANVTALVLARGLARRRELAIRIALGSGRARLVRQLLLEGLLLAGVGAGAGLAAGALVQRALLAIAPAALPEATPIGYGWPVVLFAGGVALLVGFVVGGLPALQATRSGLETGVREEARAGVGSVEHRTIRRALVVTEVAFAVVLLVGAGLLLSSLQRLRAVDVGVEADDVWTFLVNLPNARYRHPTERVRFHAALHDRLLAIPGVESVGAASRLPATGHYHGSWGTRAEGDDRIVADAQNRTVQGDWFGTLDIALLEGRLFGSEDRVDEPRRVVISRSLASRVFPGESPLGHRIVVLGDPLQIIGVVEDVPLTPRGEPAPTVYHAHEQFADDRNWPLFQAVEVSSSLPGLIERVRAELAEIDPSLVLVDPEPLASVLGTETARDRFASILVSVFALLAVSLAALGIYGVLAYDVARSSHEIGVRMALGAAAPDVRAMVARRGLALSAVGVTLGVFAALAASRVMGSLLFEVSSRDPAVIAAAAVAVLAIGAGASWIPARRATQVQPAEALRQ